jgi:3-hydroxyacyl-CoA dehydrogenase
VLIGAGSIGQAIARRVSAGKNILISDIKIENAPEAAKTLYEAGIHKNKIYLFVANKEQYKLYEEHVPKNLYNKMIIGKLGITNQRIFISKYFLQFLSLSCF